MWTVKCAISLPTSFYLLIPKDKTTLKVMTKAAVNILLFFLFSVMLSLAYVAISHSSYVQGEKNEQNWQVLVFLFFVVFCAQITRDS